MGYTSSSKIWSVRRPFWCFLLSNFRPLLSAQCVLCPTISMRNHAAMQGEVTHSSQRCLPSMCIVYCQKLCTLVLFAMHKVGIFCPSTVLVLEQLICSECTPCSLQGSDYLHLSLKNLKTYLSDNVHALTIHKCTPTQATCWTSVPHILLSWTQLNFCAIIWCHYSRPFGLIFCIVSCKQEILSRCMFL